MFIHPQYFDIPIILNCRVNHLQLFVVWGCVVKMIEED